jgi:NarL family two-component system sensor histidine kinase LiaS
MSALALLARFWPWRHQSGDGVAAAIGIYRFASWFLTSSFYLFGPPPAPIVFKLGVVLSLFLAGLLAHVLYLRVDGKDGITKILAAVETLGIVILLLPTGGRNSPFIWYAINPILVAAVELPLPWCWTIVLELFAATAGLTLLRGGNPATLFQDGHLYLLMIFLLLTLGVQLLARLVQKAYQQARELEMQRAELEHSWNLLSTLYRLVEVVSGREGVDEVLQLLASYSLDLTGAHKVIIWLGDAGDEAGEHWAVAGALDLYPEKEWKADFRRLWHELERNRTLQEGSIPVGTSQSARAVYLPVRSATKCHGVFCAVYEPGADAVGVNQYTTKFFADFTAVAVERARLEELNGQLLLAEEQNRIAGEIHDGVAQYLFSIACGCHSLREKWQSMDTAAVEEQLVFLARTASRAAQELRASIYRLSPRKQGREVFVERVKTFLNELAVLNGITTHLDVEGSEEVLSPALRKAFYRIIQEACSNSVRHGACCSVHVRLCLAPARSILEVQDDGRGWCPELAAKPGGCGLGLKNMQHLASCFDGELEIESVLGRGTVVRCTVPRAGGARGTVKEALAVETLRYR